MTTRLCVDDLRVLNLEDVTYARSLAMGLHLVQAQAWDEVYLDHDLGPIEDIKPLVTMLERAAFEEAPLPLGQIFVITGNPVAAEWMVRGLRLGYEVERLRPRVRDHLTWEESIDQQDEERASLEEA